MESSHAVLHQRRALISRQGHALHHSCASVALDDFEKKNLASYTFVINLAPISDYLLKIRLRTAFDSIYAHSLGVAL